MTNNLIKMLLDKNVESDFRQSLAEVYGGNYKAVRNLKEVVQRDTVEVPITPQESTWQISLDEENSRSLQKAFSLQSGKHVLYFVNELIRESERLNHHPVIVIDHRQVTVSLTTKDLGDITELDKLLSEYCDELYDDVVYINS